MEDSLLLSDDKIFYTIEGEGRFAGYPSIFMRLSKCNLTCIGFKSKDSPFGCDSYISWSKVNKYTFEEIFKVFETVDPFTIAPFGKVLEEGAILKITGGEPLLQQKQLIKFINAFQLKYHFLPCIDFETNGTIKPDQIWFDDLGASFTVSPKLKSNGDSEEKRYKPEVLKILAENRSCFKFVIQSEEDIKEIQEKYKFINPADIWLMPCCGSRQEQNEKSLLVAELCKKYNYKFSPRLQLLIWDKALKR
jgi:6-pyruvoyltetrahydropterin 2'-reductase